MDPWMECLEKTVEEVALVAQNLGLDFGDVHFELCLPTVLNAFAAYGMPGRFSHWSFGKAYYFLKTHYEYNLHKIYELVLNTRPVKAYLLSGGTRAQNLMIVAHVLAHSDFFRHNAHFRAVPENAQAVITAHAERLRAYELRYGHRRVEALLDAVLAVQEHIDPYSRDGAGVNRFGPQKDLLAFLAANSPGLTDWQREVVAMVREEMLYFWPQFATKITNEGWATYWHTRIMRELQLGSEEIVEWARLQADLLRPNPPGINPYGVGLRIFEAIADGRVAVPVPGGTPLPERLFWVREVADDISLLSNYLTRELVAELDLFAYQRVGQEWVVTATAGEWETVRDVLVRQFTNAGFPYLEVLEGNYQGRRELYLRHLYDGRELHVGHLEKVLPYLYSLWGRPVYLETVLGGRTVVFCYDGTKHSSFTSGKAASRQEKGPACGTMSHILPNGSGEPWKS